MSQIALLHWSSQQLLLHRNAGAGKGDPSEPEGGRYIHFYQRSVMDGHSRGFGVYIDRDGGAYSAALIVVCRKALPDDISTAERFEAMLRREFKNLPEVRDGQSACLAMSRDCGRTCHSADVVFPMGRMS